MDVSQSDSEVESSSSLVTEHSSVLSDVLDDIASSVFKRPTSRYNEDRNYYIDSLCGHQYMKAHDTLSGVKLLDFYQPQSLMAIEITDVFVLPGHLLPFRVLNFTNVSELLNQLYFSNYCVFFASGKGHHYGTLCRLVGKKSYGPFSGASILFHGLRVVDIVEREMLLPPTLNDRFIIYRLPFTKPYQSENPCPGIAQLRQFYEKHNNVLLP